MADFYHLFNLLQKKANNSISPNKNRKKCIIFFRKNEILLFFPIFALSIGKMAQGQ